jgi:hypothetical protein
VARALRSALPECLEREVHVDHRARQRRAAALHVGQQFLFREVISLVAANIGPELLGRGANMRVEKEITAERSIRDSGGWL